MGPGGRKFGTGTLRDLLLAGNIGVTYGNDARRLAMELEGLAIDRSRLATMRRRAKEVFAQEFDGRTVYMDLVSFLEDRVCVGCG